MAGDFDPRMTDLFGASYGREAAANDSINAELESKRANAMAMRGQGLQSMFNVKKGEAMLPFDLATAKAAADPELLNATKSSAISDSKLKSEQVADMLRKIPEKEFAQAALTQMAQTKSLMTSVITGIQGGASVDAAVNSALSSLPPEAKKKLTSDPAFGEQLASWTSQTSPEQAIQVLSNGINGINDQMKNWDSQVWKDIVIQQARSDDAAAQNASQERIGRGHDAAARDNSSASSLSTDKNLVIASEQRYPMPPNATPEQRNEVLDLRQQWISQHKVASIPGFANAEQTDAMNFGPQGFSTTRTTNKAPNTPAAVPQARPTQPAAPPKRWNTKTGKWE
jgi:hypothetical protein